MKKLIILQIFFILFAAIPVLSDGGEAGYIYSTDIAAYIDGMAAPSYNIGGRTAVIAEDLPVYGFEVEWNAENRVINVRTLPMPETVPQFIPQKSALGAVAGKIYETDITAYVNGMFTESYNIGGKTALVIEDMASEDDEAKRISRDGNIHRSKGYSIAAMRAEWDAQARTISLETLRPGSVLKTDFGDMEINEDFLKKRSYSYGAYNFKDENGTLISSWTNMLLIDGDSYIPLSAAAELMSAELTQNESAIDVSFPKEKPRKGFYSNAATVGACNNNIIPLSGSLSVNGSIKEYEKTVFYEYREQVYVSMEALNDYSGDSLFEYEYALPAECSDHIDDIVPSHVVVYINELAVNSYNTKDGNCYVSVKDLAACGFGAEKNGNTRILSTPVEIPSEGPVPDGLLPETYWLGDVTSNSVLYPVYNGIYDVTIDGKPLDNVYIHCTVTNKMPCISVQKLAETAGYRIDGSNPMKVRIYTK